MAKKRLYNDKNWIDLDKNLPQNLRNTKRMKNNNQVFCQDLSNFCHYKWLSTSRLAL